MIFSHETHPWIQYKGTKAFNKRAQVKDEKEEYFLNIGLENLVSNNGNIVGDTTLRTNVTSVFREKDILFGRLRPYLNKWWYATQAGLMSGEIWALYPVNNNDSLFLYYLIQTDRFLYNANISSGTRMPRASWDIIKESTYLMPDEIEQRQIGKLLEALEKTITLEQEKLECYKAIKRIIDMNLFPKNTERSPRLTFKNDTGWKNKQLKNFLSIPDKLKVEVIDTNEILSVKLYANGVVGGESRSTLKLGATTYYRRYSGQFIYGKQNFFNGAMALIPEELNNKVSSGDIPSLNISGINPKFLYQYLSRPYYYKQAEAMASGTGSKRIHEKTLLKFKIKAPNIEAQNNIEHLFVELNLLINSQTKKVSTMKHIKEYLLNNLFV